jgi:DNA polymerase-3 subunit gamma/tau
MVLLRLLPFKLAASSQPSAPAEKKTLKQAEPASPQATAPLSAEAIPRARLSPPAAVPPVPPREAAAEDGPDASDFAPHDAEPAGEPPLHDDQFDAPSPAPARAHPPLQPLPVRQSPLATVPNPPAVGQPAAPVPEAPQAADIVAVKVRESTDVDPPQARPLSSAPPALVPAAEGDFWHTVVQDLVTREAITALVRELALQSQLVARAEGQWTLRVDNESLAQSAARERLQTALAEAGHAVRLQVEVGAVADSPSRRNRIAADQRLKAAEALLLADPFVQEMMRDFGAKIVPGTIKPL